MIVVVDYGMGNLRSVSKALESLGASVRVSDKADDVLKATKVVLPGVGAFASAMRELKDRGLADALKSAIESGKPYLGICLGLQLLFQKSEEAEGSNGLGILSGSVPRFSSNGGSILKVPHMGWNQVSRGKGTGDKRRGECPLLKGISDGSFFYFVHSYYADPTERSIVALESEHGIQFAAMVWRENLFATQFHPEKSQSIGLKLLRNFVALKE